MAPFSRIHATAVAVSSPPENAIPTRSPIGSAMSTFDMAGEATGGGSGASSGCGPGGGPARAHQPRPARSSSAEHDSSALRSAGS